MQDLHSTDICHPLWDQALCLLVSTLSSQHDQVKFNNSQNTIVISTSDWQAPFPYTILKEFEVNPPPPLPQNQPSSPASNAVNLMVPDVIETEPYSFGLYYSVFRKACCAPLFFLKCDVPKKDTSNSCNSWAQLSLSVIEISDCYTERPLQFMVCQHICKDIQG